MEFTDHIGTPLQEALLLVHNTLIGLNLRDQIRVAPVSAKRHGAGDIERRDDLAAGAEAPSITMKSGVMPVSSIALQLPKNSHGLSARTALAESAPKLIAEMLNTGQE